MAVIGKLVQTCGACPEQYNIMKDGVAWGYIRLRHGSLSTEGADGFSRDFNSLTPENIGELSDVDERELSLPLHYSDGIFESQEIRDVYLSIIIERCLALSPGSYSLELEGYNDYGDATYDIVVDDWMYPSW